MVRGAALHLLSEEFRGWLRTEAVAYQIFRTSENEVFRLDHFCRRDVSAGTIFLCIYRLIIWLNEDISVLDHTRCESTDFLFCEMSFFLTKCHFRILIDISSCHSAGWQTKAWRTVPAPSEVRAIVQHLPSLFG